MEKERNIYMFTEHNSWEKETWHFFITMSKEQHRCLKDFIKDTACFKLLEKIYTKEQVTELVENDCINIRGYYRKYTYLGVLLKIPQGDPEAVLYKAGIKEFIY